MQRRTSEDLVLDTLCLLAEVPKTEVVPPPQPAELFLSYGSSGFELLPGGDLPDLFSDRGSSGVSEYEIFSQKTRAKRKPVTCSIYGKLGHCSRNRSYKNQENKHLH